MKYFGIIDKNVAAIFQLQWKIENISDMFLKVEYFKSILCKFQTNRIIIYGDKWLWMEPSLSACKS